MGLTTMEALEPMVDYIRKFNAEHSRFPTQTEISCRFGFKNGTVKEYLRYLECYGQIRRKRTETTKPKVITWVKPETDRLPRKLYINFPFKTCFEEGRVCAICGQDIDFGHAMFDGGRNKASHVHCAYGSSLSKGDDRYEQ